MGQGNANLLPREFNGKIEAPLNVTEQKEVTAAALRKRGAVFYFGRE
jgi:hypothetical protein